MINLAMLVNLGMLPVIITFGLILIPFLFLERKMSNKAKTIYGVTSFIVWGTLLLWWIIANM